MTMTIKTSNQRRIDEHGTKVYVYPIYKVLLDEGLDLNFIVGFIHNGYVYALVQEDLDMEQWTVTSFYTKGVKGTLRFRPTPEQKEEMAKSARKLMTVEKFEEYEYETRKNKKIKNNGHAFERYIHEMDGQKWRRGNTKFNTAGDINIKGQEYQVKFEHASLTRPSTLRTMYKEQTGKDMYKEYKD